MLNKLIWGLAILVVGMGVGMWGFGARGGSFESLSSEEMHGRIIAERDLAIRKAKAAGDYRCCIEPPCTMCYMEANQYNNFTAGTCACDDLIAQGKEPCPQCIRGLCSSTPGAGEETGVCEVGE